MRKGWVFRSYEQSLVGTKKKFRYLAAHAISQALGSAKSRALPTFRSFTRCDMVSELAGNSNKCMVGLGSVSEDNRVIQALVQLVQRMMDVTHRFSVLYYDRTTKLGNINGVRKELLTRKGTCARETLPPTKSSTQRVYQTSSVSRWPCVGPMHVSPNETNQP